MYLGSQADKSVAKQVSPYAGRYMKRYPDRNIQTIKSSKNEKRK